MQILTERQRQVMALLVYGKENKEIAYELSVSVQTVKNMLVQMYERMGVSGRVGAAVWWVDEAEREEREERREKERRRAVEEKAEREQKRRKKKQKERRGEHNKR